jgi:hypothetical protein
MGGGAFALHQRGAVNGVERDENEARADLAAKLRAQATTISVAVFNRIRDVSEPLNDSDPTYIAGLRTAVDDAVQHSLETIENGPEPPAQMPPLVLGQVRRAAREGVRLDTVMRRYAAGNMAMEDFIVEAASDLPATILRQVLTEQGHQVERVLDAASTAYREEVARNRRSTAKQRADRIARLLESEARVAPPDLDYDFDLWHVGIILRGRGAASAGRLLAERLGYQSLQGEREDDLAWTWLGSQRQPKLAGVIQTAREQTPAPISLAVGEARQGLAGWRLTHREAQATMQVMWLQSERVTRSRDVVLLAGVLKDETLVRSLLDAYLGPLERNGNKGEVLRETLRAFFASGWNAAAAAEELGIDRHTVRQRIRRIETILGKPLYACSAELHIALQVAELQTGTHDPDSPDNGRR